MGRWQCAKHALAGGQAGDFCRNGERAQIPFVGIRTLLLRNPAFVPRCGAGSFSLLVQRKGTKRKDTPGLRAAAAQRYPAMLDRQAGPETRGCAAQTGGPGQPLPLCASRRFAKGPKGKKRWVNNSVIPAKAGIQAARSAVP
jgi:hypothetical protein